MTQGRVWSSGKTAGTGGTTGRWFWYGEHHNPAYQVDRDGLGNFLRGGVMACSTSDFITWRNEGAMIHFSNLTVDVGPSATAPETSGLPDERYHHLIMERPKVVWNPNTQKYVMWAHMDDAKNVLGMAVVAQSDH